MMDQIKIVTDERIPEGIIVITKRTQEPLSRDDLYAALREKLGAAPFPPMVDAIVVFVAAWLQSADDRYRELDPTDLIALWREEMSGE